MLCLIIVIMQFIVTVKPNHLKDDKWKCHNIKKNKQDICNPVTYHDAQNISIECKICDNYDDIVANITICNTQEFQVTISMILEAVPLDITHLVIYYDNKWNGYLPLTPDPIVLEKVGRLRKLRYFQLNDANFKYYQLYPIRISEEALRNLTELRSLIIRTPIVDSEEVRLGDMVKILDKLEVIDVSYSRGVGGKSLRYLLENMNHQAVKHLCFRKYQLVGGVGYTSDFGDVISGSNIIFPNLIELDLSDNTIARMPPGISSMAPILEKYDISGNMLLDTSNMALVVESLMHPTIQIFSAAYQGFRGRNPDPYIHPDVFVSETYERTDKHLSYLVNEREQETSHFKRSLFEMEQLPTQDAYSTRPNSTSGLELHQVEVLFQCFNRIGFNISYTFLESKATCKYVKCILPTIFAAIDCDKQIFPTFSEVFQADCMLFTKIPIGRNLQDFYFSEVHLEQAETVGFRFTGNLCLRTPNQLQIVFGDGNEIWMQTAQVGKIVSSLDGIEGLENLTTIVLSNNSVTTAGQDSKPLSKGTLPNVKYVDISGNFVNFTDFCGLIPKLSWLNLRHTNLTKIPPSLIRNCTHLRKLLLAYNKIDVDTLDTLDLNGTGNLKLLELRGCSIRNFSKTFIRKLESSANFKLDLSFNPLHCDCHSQDFARWMIKSQGRLKNYHKYYCSGPGGLEFFNNIHPDIFWNKCDSYTIEEIIYSVVTTVSVFLFFIVLYLIYRMRWRLKYAFFKASQFCKRHLSREGDSQKKLWKYDAFISYAAEDRFWVHETLMKTLEKKYGFQLCIHYRDFPVGGDVAETISERMSQSRELVLVLSDIALKSEWCQFELDEALSQVRRRRQRLTVIKLGKIKPYVLTSKVANVLDNHTFLEWSDNAKHHKLFWAQLVGKLYDDPQGGSCMCCCPYGARSLGYQDIVDPQLDDNGADSSDEEQVCTQFDFPLKMSV